MSVKELNNPQTFDMLMNPNAGGLYDPIMGELYPLIFPQFQLKFYTFGYIGPTDRQDLCHTCQLNELNCPGHYAHITLPLPVFNPVFFTLTMQVKRM